MAEDSAQPFTTRLKEVAATLGITSAGELPKPPEKRTATDIWNGILTTNHRDMAVKLYNGLMTLATSEFDPKRGGATQKREKAIAALGERDEFCALAAKQYEASAVGKKRGSPRGSAPPHTRGQHEEEGKILSGNRGEETAEEAPKVSGTYFDPTGDKQFLQIATERWKSRFLPCLIDSSYLQSAGRALRSEANSLTDVQNLLRLIGEIVARREIYIVLATNGSVYPHSLPIIRLINETAKHDVIKIIAGEREIDYVPIAREVRGRLNESLPAWFSSLKQTPAHSDITSKGGEDGRFHSILLSGTSKVPQVNLDGRGAQFLARHVLTHPEVLGNVRKQIARMERKWVQNDTLRICSAVRAEAYIVIAEKYGYSYQPSLARFEIVNREGPRHGISEILSPDLIDGHTPSQNDIFLNALIVSSKSDPGELVRYAAAYGKDLRELGQHLASSQGAQSGDAWSLTELTNKSALKGLLKEEFEKLAKNGASEFRLTRVEDTPDGAIGRFMPLLAAPLLFAEINERSKLEMPWRKFLQKCGLPPL